MMNNSARCYDTPRCAVRHYAPAKVSRRHDTQGTAHLRVASPGTAPAIFSATTRAASQVAASVRFAPASQFLRDPRRATPHSVVCRLAARSIAPAIRYFPSALRCVPLRGVPQRTTPQPAAPAN
jgi:hypothetical protein